MDRLETNTRMIRILPEDAICATGLTLNLCRQFGAFSGTAQWCARSQFFRIELLSPPSTVLCQCLVGKVTK
jgi:hypothetical protein